MSALKTSSEILKSILGGWLSFMSGAISVPFSFLGIVYGGRPGFWFAVVAYSSLWLLVIRMAIANYKRFDRTLTNRKLSDYFKEIDKQIALVRSFGANDEDAESRKRVVEVVMDGSLLCLEIEKFINENIGPIEATFFSAKNDCTETVKEAGSNSFVENAIQYLTGKLIKLKTIMEKQL